MKINLTHYLRSFACVCIALAAISASAEEADAFVTKLKTHYQHTLPIKAYSLNYHFLNQQYRSHNYWDQQTPNKHMSVRMVEVDLEKRHFYDNDILYFSGGLLYDRVQFQNDKESIFYEKSNMFLGKAIINRGMDNFDRFKSHHLMNVDFLAVRPLLEESNISKNISLHHNSESGTTMLKHKTIEGSVIDYEFSNKPLQLVSINSRPLGGVFIYSDYQTTRGLTFARIVHKYYDGATKPNYISFNDKFDIIDQVEPNKLQIPAGYGPELPIGDGVLVAKEIGKDLYLVSDSSARRNSLFTINGDDIRVFGASGSETTANKTITLIHDRFPEKNITSVYVTHPHGHQIAGLKPFVDQGVEILADKYSIAAIKAYTPFADDIERFTFQTIEHEQIIDGAQFYVLENMHAKRQGFVYFKDSGVIFQSDFLHVPFDNTVTKVLPSYTKAFIDFVRSKQLKLNRIVANYRNNNISVEMMNKTYDAH